LAPLGALSDRVLTARTEEEALVRLKAEGASLIVTVDCGAQAFEALDAAAAPTAAPASMPTATAPPVFQPPQL